MKIIFLVIASNDPIHERDLLTQQNTWAKNLPQNVKLVSLRGWENDYFHFDGITLFVPCPEEYSLILKKTILGVRYLADHFDFDVLIRTNVSTYFHIPRLFAELQNQKYSGDFFGGYFDRTSGGYFDRSTSFEYISGTGIFLSKGATNELSKLDWKEYVGVADDVAIDHFLQAKVSRRIRMARNNLGSTHLFLPTFHIRTKSSVDSTLASKRMQFLYDFFQASKASTKAVSFINIVILEISAFFRHPEPLYLYMAKNRVVFLSYLRMKREHSWR